jgi:hypothetical protein
MFDWDVNNLRKIKAHRIAPEEAEQALVNDPIPVYEQEVEGEIRVVYYGGIRWEFAGDSLRNRLANGRAGLFRQKDGLVIEISPRPRANRNRGFHYTPILLRRLSNSRRLSSQNSESAGTGSPELIPSKANSTSRSLVASSTQIRRST